MKKKCLNGMESAIHFDCVIACLYGIFYFFKLSELPLKYKHLSTIKST